MNIVDIVVTAILILTIAAATNTLIKTLRRKREIRNCTTSSVATNVRPVSECAAFGHPCGEQREAAFPWAF